MKKIELSAPDAAVAAQAQKRPNIYKGMLGLMDLSYKEFADVVDKHIPGGADASEICRAVRGKDFPKYDLIRRLIVEEFLMWIGSVK